MLESDNRLCNLQGNVENIVHTCLVAAFSCLQLLQFFADGGKTIGQLALGVEPLGAIFALMREPPLALASRPKLGRTCHDMLFDKAPNNFVVSRESTEIPLFEKRTDVIVVPEYSPAGIHFAG